MKVEVDQKTIDKLIKKRVTAFNKEIRSLQTKLERRDKRIAKLTREIIELEKNLMEQKQGAPARIAAIAYSLVKELEGAGWVTRYHTCSDPDYCECGEYY